MIDRRSTHARAHALVIGGGLAGLLATRVLADHFDNVTLIERDPLGIDPGPRKGVPQGHHVHGLLAKGQQILSQLFPDLVPALTAGGVVPIDMGRDFRWHHHGVWKTRFDSGIEGMLFTRPYLEWHIAERVKARRNVRAISAAVDGLATDPKRRRVAGVELRGQGGCRTQLPADLVVDASGRGAQTPEWLAAIGYPRPEETVVKVDVTYASRLYRPAPGGRDWKALAVSARAPCKRMGFIFAVEGNRWLVTLGGLRGEQPPTDEAGYLDYARRLEVPDIHQAIAAAEPLTPIATYKFSTNRRRHYERVAAFPEGLLVMGDAFCSFNPIYGQGMTVSALEALALDRIMRDHPLPDPASQAGAAGMAGRFHKEISTIVDGPWRLTTGEDFRHAETPGKRPRGMALLHWYTGRMHARCADDAALALAFYRVMHMIEPPSTLFRPAIMARVLGIRRSPRSRAAEYLAVPAR